MKRFRDAGRGFLISLVVGAFIAPALAQDQPPAGAKSGALTTMQPKQFPVGVQWVLVSLNGKSVGLNQPTLQLDAQLRMRGFSGCNTFSAVAYPLKNQGLAVGPLALTRKECAKAEMDLEKAYLLGLRTTGKWEERDGSLLLVGQAGELKFDRALF
ncbi:MAG: META domain-containing protein [Alphaproteobacteria bacterium]